MVEISFTTIHRSLHARAANNYDVRMSNLRNIFFRGLITFLPIAVTIYILYAGIMIVENLLGGMIRSLIPESYVPGIGFLVTVALIFSLGLMLNSLVIGGLLHQAEKMLLNVPLIKAVYSPLRDLMNLFSKTGQGQLKSVVLVEFSPGGPKALGLITRESFDDLQSIPRHITDQNVTVYIPWSYGVGGLTFLIPRSKLTPLDIPADKALSLAVTAWVRNEDDKGKKP
jgi:uncharacterized membrane protein